jgi:hypothetical protein
LPGQYLPAVIIQDTDQVWLEPATVKKVKGADCAGYDQAQRAYIFTLDESVVSFTLNGSEKSPIENPCFVIKNWDSDQKAKLKVNGDSQSIGTTNFEITP